MLLECQKAQREESCRRLVQRFERERGDFLSRIVTADETWINLYEPESKKQSPSPKKLKLVVNHVLRHPRRHP